MITLRIGHTALPYGPVLRASWCHAADWAHGRVAFTSSQGTNSPAHADLGLRPSLRSKLPMGLSPRFALSRCGGFTTRGFPSTRTNPGPTGWVLGICPRSGPSALFRTPPRFGLGRDRYKLVAGILSHLRPFVHPLFLLTAAAKTHAKSVWMLYNIVKSLAVSRPTKEVNRL